MISSATSFGKYVDIARRELSVLKYREDVIANNIANHATPNFRRSVVNFESHLKEAIDSERYNPSFKAFKTHKNHIDFHRAIDYRTVTPRRFLDWQTQTNNNGNNVSIEQETSDNIKNTLLYNMITLNLRDSYRRINMIVG